jgi:hypothetical protein
LRYEGAHLRVHRTRGQIVSEGVFDLKAFRKVTTVKKNYRIEAEKREIERV